MATSQIHTGQITGGESTLARYTRAVGGAIILCLILIAGSLLYASLGSGSSRDLLVNQLLISAIMVAGLQIFIGNTGILSFGHMAFATIAGYTVALLTMPMARKLKQIPDAPFGVVELNTTPLVATIIAVVIVVLLGVILSLALTRSGAKSGAVAATMITLALLFITHEAATKWSDLTDGGTGLGFIPQLENRIPLFIGLFISVMVARLFGETHTGRWAKAAREDSVASNVLGIDPKNPQMVALLLSVAIVAVGASLRVQDFGSMAPSLMYFDYTLLTLAMLVVGGRHSVTGALVGVVIIIVGTEISRIAGSDWDIPGLGWLLRPTLTQLFLGAVMLGTMLLRPNGLIKDWELDHLLLHRRQQKEQPPVQKTVDTPATDRKTHTLTVADLAVDFGGFRALNAVSIEVKSNEIVGLIGPNGAGKTTLLNAITGFVPTTDGTVTLNGQRLTGLEPFQISRKGIARTFQNLRLFQDLSVLENVTVAGITRDQFEDETLRTEPDQLLLSANLWDQRNARAGDLDYGNQRRLELARAAAVSPHFLLLDEPTSGMSDDESTRMVDHIRNTATSVDAGVLVIDHDLHFITQICDRVYVLNYGTLLASGTPEEIRANEEVRTAYLGS